MMDRAGQGGMENSANSSHTAGENGPADDETNDDRRPSVSFIVPSYNASSFIAETISSIRAEAPPDSEVIVVDDGSFDSTVDVARQSADTVIVRPCQGGAARARNDGAHVARGDFFVFVDSDVTVCRGAISGMLAHLNAGSAAVFGAYTEMPPADARNYPTNYKNLLHHYTHLEGSGEASTFWSGFGGIRRKAFWDANGFDTGATTTADVEDIHLGYRLRQLGYRIVLDPSLRVEHHKRYTLKTLMASDFLHRAIPWTRAMLELREFRTDLNLSKGSLTSAALAFVVAVALLLTPFYPVAAPALLVTGGFAWWMLNRHFFRFVRKVWSLKGMSASVGIHFLYYLYAPLGAILGVTAHLLRHHHRSFLNRLNFPSRSEQDDLALTVAVIKKPKDPLELPHLPVPEAWWELLVVAETEPENLPEGARFIRAAPMASRNQMRDQALAVASGRMLALLDGHHRPDSDWLAIAREIADEPFHTVGGSLEYENSGVLERAYEVARLWQWRTTRGPTWLVDHVSSNIVINTEVARAMGGFEDEGALLLRLAGFGARPVRYRPDLHVDILGRVSLNELTKGLAGVGRLRAATSTRYFDLGLPARMALVGISPLWAIAGFYSLVRDAMREKRADRIFWMALPLALAGGAAYWLGRNIGTLLPGQRGGAIPEAESTSELSTKRSRIGG